MNGFSGFSITVLIGQNVHKNNQADIANNWPYIYETIKNCSPCKSWI